MYKILTGIDLISGKWLDGNPYNDFTTQGAICEAILAILFKQDKQLSFSNKAAAIT